MNTHYTPATTEGHESLGVRLGIVSPDYPESQAFSRGRMFLGIYASVIALFAVSFVALTIFVKDNATLQFDLRVAHWIQGTNLPSFLHAITQSPIYSQGLTFVSDIGNSPWSFIAYGVVFVALFVLGLRIEAAVAVGGSVVAFVLGTLLRSYIDRARPSAHFLHVAQHIGGAGFPSGHVMMYVTLFGFAFYVVLIAFRKNVLSIAVLAVLAFLVITIGLSRVYLGAHWPTDTTGAYLLGWLMVAGMIEIHRTVLSHVRLNRPAAAPPVPQGQVRTA